MKKSNVSNITKSFIKSKFKYFIFLCGIILSSIALIIIISAMFNGLIYQIDEKNAYRYGKHQAITYNISLDDKSSLLKDERITKSGSILNYGSYHILDSEEYFTVGYFDRQALTLSNLHLIDGDWPDSNNEIAIEKHILDRLDSIDIGSVISIKNHGETHFFKLTGIISDYSGTWNVPEEIISGKTDVPEAIIGNGELHQEYAESLMISLSAFDEYNILDLFSSHNLNPYYSVINTKYYIIGQNELLALNIFKNVFIISLILIVQVILYYCCRQFIFDVRNSYKILRILGSKYKMLYRIYGCHSGAIIILSLLFGIIIGLSISMIIGEVYAIKSYSILFNQTVISCLISLLLNILIMIALFHKYVVSFCRASLDKDEDADTKPMKIKKDFYSAIIKYNFQRNIKKLFPIILAFSCIFILIGAVNVYFSGSILKPDKNTPDFILQPNSMDVYQEYGAYQLYKSSNAQFDFDDIEEILSNDDINLSISEISTKGIVIISELDNQYWPQWNNIAYTDTNLSEYPAVIPKNVSASNDYRIILSNSDLIELIESRYSINIDDENTILFLPYYLNDKTNLDKIKLFKLYKDKDISFDYAVNNTDCIKSLTEEIFVDVQINDALFIENGENSIYSEKPTLIIPYERVINSSLFTGIGRITIYLNDNLSNEKREEFDNYYRSFTRGFSDSYFFSLYEIEQSEREQSVVINISLYLISGILIIFLMIVFYQTMYLEFYNRRKVLGIYRAIGLDYQNTNKIILFELKKYLHICMLISFSFLIIQNFIARDMDIIVGTVISLGITYVILLLSVKYVAKRISRLFKEENIINQIQYKE